MKIFWNYLGVLLVLCACAKKKESEVELEPIDLNLRVHLMQTDPWIHGSGVSMDTWVTRAHMTDTVFPELNSIWSAAKINWTVESILEEQIVKGDTYQESVDYVLNTERNDEGEADPARLPYLYSLMQPSNRSTKEQLRKNLFHIYLFPFTGNTSQGNAMSGFGNHVVIGAWSNKYSSSKKPEKMNLTEDHATFVKGSLGATMSHELGHVLGLNHNECTPCLMQSNGYDLTESQIATARSKASARTQ